MGSNVSPFMAFVPGPYQEPGLEALRSGFGTSRVGRFAGTALAGPLDITREAAQGAVGGVARGIEYAMEDPEAARPSPAAGYVPPPGPPPPAVDVGADAIRSGMMAATPRGPSADVMRGLQSRAFGPATAMAPEWGDVRLPGEESGMAPVRPAGQMVQDEAARQALDAIYYGNRARAIEQSWQERFGPQVWLDRMRAEREAEEMMAPSRPLVGPGGAFTQQAGVYGAGEPQTPVGIRRRIEAPAAGEVAKTQGVLAIFSNLQKDLDDNIAKITADKGLSSDERMARIKQQIQQARLLGSLLDRMVTRQPSYEMPGEAQPGQ